jgi:Ca-activated chloride channel family protein
MRFAAQTWLLLLMGLPFLGALLRWSDRRARRRLRELLGTRAEEHVERDHPRLRQWQRFLLFSCLFWLIVALARPQWGAHDVTVKEKGTDIVIALDISNSMRAEDVPPSRLARAESELSAFLEQLPRGRVGLVMFAGAAFVQCPLTLDYGTAQLFLRMAAPDMISEQGTAIGAALATSRELLKGGGGGGDAFRAIVLVTDGEDLEGSWEQELEICRREGIVVLPIGVGQETGGLIPVTDDQGRPAGYLKDDEGNVVMTLLDLAALERMAALTGGSLFRLGPTSLVGQRLQDALARLGERELEERRISALEERFVWPLGLACLALLVQMLLRPRRRRVASAEESHLAAPHGLTALPILVVCLTLLGGPVRAGVEIRPPGATTAEQGRQQYAAQHYEEALQAFETARALNPDDPRLSLALGETLYRLERFDEAAVEFQRALALGQSPELKAESLYNAGTCRLAQGDPAGAVELLRRALDLDPSQQDVLHNLELAMRQLQQDSQNQQQGQQQPQQGQQQNQQQDQQQGQQQDQQGGQQQRQQGQQQDQQQGQQQDQQQQQQDQQQDQQQTGQDQQQTDQAKPEGEEASSPEAGTEQPAAPEAAEEQSVSPEEMSKERALGLLRALDRDEEQLKRSVQRRLHGSGAKSGKRW